LEGGERRGEERRGGRGELEIAGQIHSKQNKPGVSSLAKKFKIKW